MKNSINASMSLGLLLSAQFCMAGFSVPLGVATKLPLELGGIAGVAALTLIVATQLIKRRK